MQSKVLVLLAEGFEDVEAVTAIDILRRARADVTVAGVTPAPIRGARHVAIMPDAPLAEVATALYDAVIVPGGAKGAENIAASQQCREIVTRHNREGKWVAAICAAPAVVLGPWGLLDGRKATGFPGTEDRFPATATFIAEPVVIDGNLVTSRAPGTALRFSLALVSKICGSATAEQIASAVLAS